jgi:hypothetical protein
MDTGCSAYRNDIPRALAGDLEAQAREALDRHIAGCPECAGERELYEATLTRVRRLRDVPVPRHFFVHPESRQGAWRTLSELPPAWRICGGLAAAAALVLVVLAAASFQIRAENGAITLGFGTLPRAAAPRVAAPAPVLAVDTKALQDGIIAVLAERNRKESLEWVRTLRSEIARAGSRWNEQQRLALDTALSGLEARMNGRLTATASSIQSATDSSLERMYQAVRYDREQDTAALNSRIARVAATTEMKGNQTDVILDTLLQVADLRLK